MSSSPDPLAPRPALRPGARGGTARPAPVRLTSFHAQLQELRPGEQAGGARREARKKDEIVTVKVEMPKSMRKQLRMRAEEAGYSAEDAVYHLVRSWLQA
ncbi:hypothetical protein EV189_2915 [Motilibacter rhizosphaerae]|uniref:Uncharacterized protein n=1 Tax=Motilibacter rhizosphaerae TaxID=598652 RepID=A0A4Q7NQ73_9ACTN|nr:hypothetical protein [Motilibacter rhizosphaerae]RZS87484.1 hypothetical protein EV189_2915 [Motilibacter rhizosphaerae]